MQKKSVISLALFILTTCSANIFGMSQTEFKEYLKSLEVAGKNKIAELLKTKNGRQIELREADLEGQNLADADLYEANFYKAKLKNINLSNAILEGAHLLEADLTNANLQDAKFNNANLRTANLRNATLSGTNFKKATVTDAIFIGAKAQNVDLTGTNITEYQLNQFAYHCNTNVDKYWLLGLVKYTDTLFRDCPNKNPLNKQ